VIKEKIEKTNEVTTNRRAKRVWVLRKKLANRLSTNNKTIEKVGNKNKVEVEANWDSPHGRE